MSDIDSLSIFSPEPDTDSFEDNLLHHPIEPVDVEYPIEPLEDPLEPIEVEYLEDATDHSLASDLTRDPEITNMSSDEPMPDTPTSTPVPAHEHPEYVRITPASASSGASRAGYPNCVIGYPCGRACISRNKACRITGTPAPGGGPTTSRPSGSRTGYPNCVTGKPCGRACIAQWKTCHIR